MFRKNTGKEESKSSVTSSELSLLSINLRKSVCAIKGIGEKFAANPHTGNCPRQFGHKRINGFEVSRCHNNFL
jgi:hypothetical protein